LVCPIEGVQELIHQLMYFLYRKTVKKNFSINKTTANNLSEKSNHFQV